MSKKESLKRQVLLGGLGSGILLTVSLAALFIFYPACAYAISVEVSGGDWDIPAIGIPAIGAEGTDSIANTKWTVTGSSHGNEDIDISVSDTTTSPPNVWTPADTEPGNPGVNIFVLRTNPSASVDQDPGNPLIHTSGTRLKTGLQKFDTCQFGLSFTAPALGSDDSMQHTLTVVLTASNLDRWGRVFVTSTTYDGDLGGLDGGDAKCQARADDPAAALGGTWTAWLSDVDTNAKARITDQPYYLLDDTKVCDNVDPDLIDDSIAHEINMNELLGAETTYVWTGTGRTGIKFGSPCGNFTSSSHDDYGLTGDPSTAAVAWTQKEVQTCDNLCGLYCFER